MPAATVVTAEPATVHTGVVPELNDTGSPDDADADRVTGAPTVTSGGCPNVIVCARLDLERQRRLAAVVRVVEGRDRTRPAAMVVTGASVEPRAGLVEPPTVHTGGVSKWRNTGSPDDEDADTVTVAPTIWLATGTKVIVSATATTLTEAVSQAFCTFADGLVSW